MHKEFKIINGKKIETNNNNKFTTQIQQHNKIMDANNLSIYKKYSGQLRSKLVG